MRFRMLWVGATALLVAGVAHAETSVGVNISIGDAPPPPVVVVREEPAVLFVPEARVYVVRDSGDDWFRVGSVWYIERNGWWYKASSHRGPYRVIEQRYVPAAIWKVPKKHWRNHPHGGPPGQAKKSQVSMKSKGRY